jgi:hypothetical protein
MDSTCGDVNFDGVTDVYGNAGGGFVAFNKDTGAVQCFGNWKNGGQCPPGLVAKPGLVLYEAFYAFLLYDPKEKTGVCWGDSQYGGDCSSISFENVTEIVGNGLGFVGLEPDEGTAECWGAVSCGMSFANVTKLFAGSSNFVALEDEASASPGFCFPLACPANTTFAGVDTILAPGPAFIGLDSAGNLEPVCFGPSEGDITPNENIETACASLDPDAAGPKGIPSQIMVAGIGDNFYIVAYDKLLSLDTRQQIKTRASYLTLPSGIDATGDVLDHVVVLYGGAYGTTGTYLQKPGNMFVKQDGTWSIFWDGCKWQLSRTTVMVNLECEDDVYAANALFGNAYFDGTTPTGTSRFDADICAAAELLGHCKLDSTEDRDVVFAAVCSGTCGATLADQCTHDNDAAMVAYSKFNNMPKMTCAQAEELCDTSLVISAICKSTCGFATPVSPAEHKQNYSHEEYNEKFFRERRMFRLEGRSLAVKSGGPSYKPVKAEEKFVFMGTWPSSDDPATCSSTMTAVYGVDALTTTSICELSSLGSLTDYVLEKTCTPTVTYATTSYAYCPWMNVDITDSRIAAYMCPDVPRDENVLCANRETCEMLCTSLGNDCIGFDFVLGEDRCYLNRFTVVPGNPPGSYCSSDSIVAGTGGVQPPEQFTSGIGYGYWTAYGIRMVTSRVRGASSTPSSGRAPR